MTKSVFGRWAPLVLALSLVATSAASAQAGRPPAEPLVGAMPLPGGVAALLEAMHVPGDTDPAVAMPAFVRAVHVLPALPSTDAAAYLDAATREHRPAEDVPLPLSPDWWSRAVFRRAVPRQRLAAAIFGERRAAFTYLGLMSLDDDTLAYWAEHPGVASQVAGQSAGAFAQWGRSIHVANGRVLVPGGDEAAASWRMVVGEPPTDPDRFIVSLLAKDDGRAAHFYDAVAHMDRGSRAFALGSALGPENGAGVLKKLYGIVATTRSIDSRTDWPVVRHPFNPMAMLRQVRVDDAGVMSAPGSRGFWNAVFDRNPRACADVASDARPADAAWLIGRIEREVLEERGRWLGAIAFAQRVFAGVQASELPAACAAAAAFPRNDALMLALERAGLEKPPDYVDVLQFAARAWSGLDRRAAVFRTAQLEGIVQALQQAVSARVLAPDAARKLLRSLVALQSSGDRSLSPGAIGRWFRATLQPAVCRAQETADGCLIRLVSGAGQRPAGSSRISWEDDVYTVDLGAATAVRVERVLQAQHATSVEDALVLLDAAAAAGKASAPRGRADAAALVKAVAPRIPLDLTHLFGHPVPAIRSSVDTVAGRLSAASEKNCADAASTLIDAADVLLTDALVSFAYATAIGDPDDAVLMGGNPARRHLFDSTIGPATGPWRLAEEVQGLDKSWLIEGSVVMLRTVYARTWLRRLSMHDPGAGPRPTPQDQHQFGESATAFSPFALTEAGRDAIVSAIRRGRARLVVLVNTPADLWKAAETYRLGEWRCRAALWAASRRPTTTLGTPPDAERFFSLAELLWLGDPTVPAAVLDAWGVGTRPIDGGVSVRMPRTSTWEDLQGPRGVGLLPTQVADVHLRTAEALAALKLPAVLAPDVAVYAVWDVMSGAAMAHADDWLALVRAARAIPPDRFLDYVSALTAIGPLMPAR